MPTYEYLCGSCGHRFSTRQRITEDALRDCPECGEASLDRLVFPVGILKSGPSKVISGHAAARQEPDRAKLAVSDPKRFDRLIERERGAGGRLPVDVVD